MFGMKAARTSPELLRRLKESAECGPMTPAELREQKISFIIGQTPFDSPAPSREYVGFLIDNGRPPKEGEI